ncbi:MAG TPA: cyclic nucleotide-binding protein [Gammaproteobacteria bacterium]|nr:cyclic nucleotide-binding protein [Gammaproteobacteria bacterium]
MTDSADEQAAAEALPEFIAKYRITGIAGRGAMGVVYRGHDPFVDREVAIKVATGEGGGRSNRSLEVAKRLFFNEARSAGVLDHPNILRVFDAGEDSTGRPYMVMEFVEGSRTLRDHTTEGQLLPVPKVLEAVRQTADALVCAHAHGVIHRDIKPANLLLTPSGAVKVGDFGIAQRLQGDETQVLGWFGSPQYMSPEQARDDDLSPRSDVFSLGCVMYELLSGRRAFEARGLTALLNKLLNSDPLPLTELRPELPPAVTAVVDRCLRKDPAQRLPSAAALVTALDAAMKDLGSGVASLPEAEQLAVLRGLGWFAGFAPNDLREVLKAGRWQTVAQESTLEEACSLHIVLRGSLAVSLQGRRLYVAAAGESLGEVAYATGRARGLTLTALETAEVLTLSAPAREWASLACQMRFAQALGTALAERQWKTLEALAAAR